MERIYGVTDHRRFLNLCSSSSSGRCLPLLDVAQAEVDEIAAAQAAADAAAVAADAATQTPAIPARCQGIPTNTTVYTMCINAPGFPDSP